MQNQTAAYLPSPSPVTLIVYQKEPYQYVAVFVNQTRQQAEETFKKKYDLQSEETYEVKGRLHCIHGVYDTHDTIFTSGARTRRGLTGTF